MPLLEQAISAGFDSTGLAQLAAAHVTVGRYLSSIVDRGSLRPRYCEVLDRDVLYFSYGAPYYRPWNRQTEDLLEFPIVLLFGVEALSLFSRFYPFDSGAVATQLFGPHWSAELHDLEELYATHRPERLVACFYESNQNYLRGKVAAQVPNQSPLPSIHAFLADNISSIGADQRQRTIECVTEAAVTLTRNLLWIAYPNGLAREVGALWNLCPNKFRHYAYDQDTNDNPASLMSHLRMEAKEIFKYLYMPPTDF